ncbi:MAG: hypothetical protein WCQ73_00490 [Candidatus Cloacimonadaceae bacterium]|jgi:hypothetical protein|nr:hypothetical protein [Candidatus Cloacimonadota bacterium]MDY0381549.1 hypothetical protein [Candidatus Cloacimonadaceae bacterium]HCM15776.1 hypothetical protein [Candidatus Cloacimonas sp.]MCB5263957.1 hypothetical protein [Candidatus Cloacimonadota bacterium]MCB5276362.1 hypothetical protein [Candidatus Cloacimonadota bacterium]
MKRSLPLIFAFVVGIIVLISEFIPHRPFNQIVSTLENWFMIISGFAILLGQISLIRMNANKIANRLPDWQYHLAGLVSFALMLIFGLLWGMQETPGLMGDGQGISAYLGSKPFDYLFENAYMPLSATLFSLLAFFIASAAYRAFIIRGFESNLLMITAVIVIIGRTSIGTMLTGWLPESLSFWHIPNLADFIMEFPNSAAQRAILISAGLGIVGSSLRIILGIERSYLGGDK